jgi:hypothetical protein
MTIRGALAKLEAQLLAWRSFFDRQLVWQRSMRAAVQPAHRRAHALAHISDHASRWHKCVR